MVQVLKLDRTVGSTAFDGSRLPFVVDDKAKEAEVQSGKREVEVVSKVSLESVLIPRPPCL